MLVEKEHCTGCSACASACPKQCISMKRDSEGFSYPEIDWAACARCGLCEKACPVKNQTGFDYTPSAYAAYCKDEKIRRSSSSGGLFTVFAKEVIDRGGVVLGACFDENFHVVHGFAETKPELEKFRGSKYVQSEIGGTYRQARNFLECGRLVYFSGTPCQIGGLKAFLGKEYENLICQDLICHGAPSPKVWEKYVAFREAGAGAPAREVSFRDKTEGWKRFSLSVRFQNGREYREPLDRDSYLQVFLNNADLRPSCYRCVFKTLSRQSDLTLADFWGVETVFPELCDDKGVSLVLVHSEKGRRLLEETAGALVLKEFDSSRVPALNPAACRSARLSPKREKFFVRLDRWDFGRLSGRYGRLSGKRKLIGLVKGMLRILGLYAFAKKAMRGFSSGSGTR